MYDSKTTFSAKSYQSSPKMSYKQGVSSLETPCLYGILENELELFAGLGNVCLIGDLNSRPGLLCDNNENDNIHQTLLDNMESLFSYPCERPVTQRKSKDQNVNSYGRRLITLCRESGLRIINGRQTSDKFGEITFQNRQGTSVIDIACIHFTSFDIVADFEVGDFTEFSDHAPICLTLRIRLIQSDSHCTCQRYNETVTVWNSESADQLYQCVLINRDSLTAIKVQISKLKTQKSPGLDCLLNEMFIKCKDVFIPILKKLFDHILNTGIYPEEWSKGAVIPVYKKGDSSDAGNYRPITLISHLAKLFTAIIF